MPSESGRIESYGNEFSPYLSSNYCDWRDWLFMQPSVGLDGWILERRGLGNYLEHTRALRGYWVDRPRIPEASQVRLELHLAGGALSWLDRPRSGGNCILCARE